MVMINVVPMRGKFIDGGIKIRQGCYGELFSNVPEI